MERNAIQRLAVRTHLLLDLNAVRVVRPRGAHSDEMQQDEQQQCQRQECDVQREEAVERGVGYAVVPSDPFHEPGADSRDRAEQVHDHLRAPERHVAPGQHVAHERLGHQRQVHEHAHQPQQLARRLVRPVQESPEHVQVDDDEERRCAGRVQIADQPAPIHFPHDEFDRIESGELPGLVEHGEEDAGEQLHHQHQQGERAEEVPDIEVLRGVIALQLAVDELLDRQPLVDPGHQTLSGVWALGGGVTMSAGGGLGSRSHHTAPFSSWPTTSVR